MYLCFFPVTVAMVQGPRSPQVIETEMLRTYAPRAGRPCGCCAWPASLPFLFPASRGGGDRPVVVGAIVSCPPARAGRPGGAPAHRFYLRPDPVQIWSALLMSAVLGLALTA